MGEKYIDATGRKLVYLGGQATSRFWDDKWAAGLGVEEQGLSLASRRVLKLARKYLSSGRVLEAGCGHGGLVYAFAQAGWHATGVDFAPKTVARINETFPNLDIRLGDVRNLELEDNSYDLYFSGGVIEHFPSGYLEALSEAYRVLVPGGRALFSFPAMNPLRKSIASCGGYERIDLVDPRNVAQQFYQFALDPDDVSADLRSVGFEMVARKWSSAAFGLADELVWFKGWLTQSPKLVRRALSFMPGSNVWGHSVFLICQKPTTGSS